ncbi:DUF2254 family protein [Streptomyces sp. NPDC057806]|uniref:DUF2254 family protein n=1 Tax=Streptomyces sp. NPDC057806 TaxID=3346255 RepID=UPI0036BD1740
MATEPLRARPPHRGSGSQRARRARSNNAALVLVAAGALLGWALPRWERHLPEAGLSFDASTAQATLAAIAGGMITLAGFVVTAITLVVQTVQAMSPRLVSALGHFSRYLVLFGLLIGTALYALVALSQIRGDSVPRVSVTLAIGLVLIDAVTVLRLLASLRHAVTGGGLARAVGERLRTVIDEVFPAGGPGVGGRGAGGRAGLAGGPGVSEPGSAGRAEAGGGVGTPEPGPSGRAGTGGGVGTPEPGPSGRAGTARDVGASESGPAGRAEAGGGVGTPEPGPSGRAEAGRVIGASESGPAGRAEAGGDSGAAYFAVPRESEDRGATDGTPLIHRGPPAVVFAIDEPRLTRLAARHDVRVLLRHAVGDFVGSGVTVGRLDGRGPLPAGLARRAASCVRYGPTRTVQQDVGYGFRLLADIAIRSLSPAVNDPTTAVQALDQIEEGLLRLAGRPLGPAWLLDRAGRPRVRCPAPQWPDFVSLALDETLLYGCGNPQVVRRLRALLDRVGAEAPKDRAQPLHERRAALDRLTATALPDPLLNRMASHPDSQGLGAPNDENPQ